MIYFVKMFGIVKYSAYIYITFKTKTMETFTIKGTTYKITGEKGDYFIAEDNRGNMKIAAKRDVEVVEIETMPKVKHYRKCGKLSKSESREFQADLRECVRAEHTL